VHFVGKVLATREEVLQAQQVSNHGGYVITNETGTWGLDCFQTAARHQCFASMANSPYMCKDVSRNTHPSANVQKSCKRMGNGTCVFGLIASQDIPAFTVDHHTFFLLNITNILDKSHKGIKISDRSVKRK
jgi:hypothetical protein